MINNFKRRKEYIERQMSYAEDAENKEPYRRKLRALYLEERATYSNDLVQPDDPRFQTLYKNEWLKREKEKKQAELKAKRIKAERDKFYKDNILEGKSKVMNALELEDKLRYEGNKHEGNK